MARMKSEQLRTFTLIDVKADTSKDMLCPKGRIRTRELTQRLGRWSNTLRVGTSNVRHGIENRCGGDD